jgi:hypothetical protein
MIWSVICIEILIYNVRTHITTGMTEWQRLKKNC